MSTDWSTHPLLDGRGAVSALGRISWSFFRGAAFWTAALLPLSYLPMLYAIPFTFGGFLKLLALNAVALLVGHRYGEERGGEAG